MLALQAPPTMVFSTVQLTERGHAHPPSTSYNGIQHSTADWKRPCSPSKHLLQWYSAQYSWLKEAMLALQAPPTMVFSTVQLTERGHAHPPSTSYNGIQHSTADWKRPCSPSKHLLQWYSAQYSWLKEAMLALQAPPTMVFSTVQLTERGHARPPSTSYNGIQHSTADWKRPCSPSKHLLQWYSAQYSWLKEAMLALQAPPTMVFSTVQLTERGHAHPPSTSYNGIQHSTADWKRPCSPSKHLLQWYSAQYSWLKEAMLTLQAPHSTADWFSTVQLTERGHARPPSTSYNGIQHSTADWKRPCSPSKHLLQWYSAQYSWLKEAMLALQAPPTMVFSTVQLTERGHAHPPSTSYNGIQHSTADWKRPCSPSKHLLQWYSAQYSWLKEAMLTLQAPPTMVFSTVQLTERGHAHPPSTSYNGIQHSTADWKRPCSPSKHLLQWYSAQYSWLKEAMLTLQAPPTMVFSTVQLTERGHAHPPSTSYNGIQHSTADWKRPCSPSKHLLQWYSAQYSWLKEAMLALQAPPTMVFSTVQLTERGHAHPPSTSYNGIQHSTADWKRPCSPSKHLLQWYSAQYSWLKEAMLTLQAPPTMVFSITLQLSWHFIWHWEPT